MASMLGSNYTHSIDHVEIKLEQEKFSMSDHITRL